MIINIFKSEVVEKNSICKERKNFTFNLGQSTKYNYHSVDAPNSHGTKVNEAQMNKVLSKRGM